MYITLPTLFVYLSFGASFARPRKRAATKGCAHHLHVFLQGKSDRSRLADMIENRLKFMYYAAMKIAYQRFFIAPQITLAL